MILGVHAAFHVLYMLLATFHREWALQQNLSRVQVRGSCHCSCCLLSLQPARTLLDELLLFVRLWVCEQCMRVPCRSQKAATGALQADFGHGC